MVKRGFRLRAKRRHVAAFATGSVQAIVARAIEIEDRHPLLKERDEGKKERAVQPLLIEVVGRYIAGRDNRDAAREELLEQPPEDHRVGDIVDSKLVEAQKLDLRRDLVCRCRDRITAVRSAILWRPAMGRNALLNFEHERKKVNAALADRVRGFEEDVHQKRLAASNCAKNIKSARLGPVSTE